MKKSAAANASEEQGAHDTLSATAADTNENYDENDEDEEGRRSRVSEIE